MSPEERKAARRKLGLTQSQLALILGTSKRAVEGYEAQTAAAQRSNPIADRVLRWLLDGFRPPEWPR